MRRIGGFIRLLLRQGDVYCAPWDHAKYCGKAPIVKQNKAPCGLHQRGLDCPAAAARLRAAGKCQIYSAAGSSPPSAASSSAAAPPPLTIAVANAGLAASP